MNLSIVICSIVFIFFKLIYFSKELTDFACSLYGQFPNLLTMVEIG
jgi:hypothetical protein